MTADGAGALGFSIGLAAAAVACGFCAVLAASPPTPEWNALTRRDEG